MRFVGFVLLLVHAGYSGAAEFGESLKRPSICEFDFNTKVLCVYHNLTVEIDRVVVEAGEISIQKLVVFSEGKTHTLDITPDTTLLDGDKGFISFDDINFDGTPDIAVTTSFGVSNLYLDYWVYDTQHNKYIRIGNYSKFTIDRSSKTLANVIKISAAEYEKNIYFWKDYMLVKK